MNIVFAKTQKTELGVSAVSIKTNFYKFEIDYHDSALEVVKAYFDKILGKGIAFFFISEDDFKANHHYEIKGGTITENWYEDDQKYVRLSYVCGIPAPTSLEKEMEKEPNKFLQVPIPNIHPYFRIESDPSIFSVNDPFEVNCRPLMHGWGISQFPCENFYKII